MKYKFFLYKTNSYSQHDCFSGLRDPPSPERYNGTIPTKDEKTADRVLGFIRKSESDSCDVTYLLNGGYS